MHACLRVYKRVCICMHNGLCQWRAKSSAWRDRTDFGGSNLVTPCWQVRCKEQQAGEQDGEPGPATSTHVDGF